MNIDRPAGLYNMFSNVWLFFGYNHQEHDHILKKVKALHGITKMLCLDDLCKFWVSGISNTDSYAPEIRQQMIIDRRTKLISIYKNIAAQIDIAIRANNSESAPTVLCLYTLSPLAFECLIGAYLYYLNKRASMSLVSAARALSSKITGVEYQMTEEMKQFLYLVCSNTD